MTNPDPTSPQERTPPGEDLREYLELVDQAVDAITDADVDVDLAAMLTRAGYDPPPVIAQSDLRMAEFELAALSDTIEAADLECELRATSAELDRLRVEVAAARRARHREVGRLHEAVNAAAAAGLRAAEAQERAQGAAVGAEAYVDTALDRAQEIFDRARADAEPKEPERTDPATHRTSRPEEVEEPTRVRSSSRSSRIVPKEPERTDPATHRTSRPEEVEEPTRVRSSSRSSRIVPKEPERTDPATHRTSRPEEVEEPTRVRSSSRSSHSEQHEEDGRGYGGRTR
ncbi:hypothetical protein B0I29_12057 [Actinoplanes lutulentus]|uniref:Uncharacterized protein n=1 Tax=Actinoplanes lutulentus TaxID=1287878 RepID=A0A327Z4F6_9ACTN|nr:hypothetical protein [Actinoplanes lutulentus]RAK28289.1 hypothetical protein B0I29_12057 [Actinoplanes lutulentus]